MSPQISRLSAVAAVAAVASAATTSYSTSKSAEPCAQISNLFAKDIFEFPSQLGLACLDSLPFKSDLAVSFVDELSKYLEWHSTIEILRNPPPGSLSATVDLLGGMSSIRNRASANLYKSQYDFDWDLNHLFASTNDGHLFLQSCSFNVLPFINPAPLVSLSTDGVTIPKLYTLSDGYLLAEGNTDISAVTLINGVGAEAYLEQLSETQGFQDPDARYNAMLANVPIGRDGSQQNGAFAFFGSFPGVHEFNLTFANGTKASFPLSAGISASLGNFTFADGDALWEGVCDPKLSKSESSKKVKRDDGDEKKLPAPATYPKPVIKDPFNLILGYFPTDKALKDVAVLTVPTFETSGDGLPDNANVNFALEAQKFVVEAVAAGKSKIIVDLTGNPGGSVDSGFALVSIFFPNMTIFSATRYRSVPATQYIIQTINRAKDPLGIDLITDAFFVPALVKPDQKSTFDKVADFEGPFYAAGVPSTAILAENDFTKTNSTTDPINIFGLGGKLNGTEPPFKPEDIIILTDGQCSSTCTIFINHMIPYGVRVVTVGGRAHSGPMQGIGGVKGSQTLSLDTISAFYELANELVNNATEAKKPLFTDKEFSVFENAIPVALEQMPIKLNGGQVNFRNAFAPFNDQLPTHFIYQAADCRLFYTPETLSKPETLWVNTANAAWHGGKCIFTSMPRKPLIPLKNSTSTEPEPETPPASKPTSTPTPGRKKTQSSAHKALALLLAMAEGLRAQ
ncbi:peptidase s41 family [Trichoderma arundinaceum]|uniref:Peptidase s41 family n=1 Tax=Trichoderma arundinaceum TaxID=490622 RepID=A0A395P0W2_TRIAR|nr:peptidase s41 family [Trichoderma arundinaceum]